MGNKFPTGQTPTDSYVFNSPPQEALRDPVLRQNMTAEHLQELADVWKKIEGPINLTGVPDISGKANVTDAAVEIGVQAVSLHLPGVQLVKGAVDMNDVCGNPVGGKIKNALLQR